MNTPIDILIACLIAFGGLLSYEVLRVDVINRSVSLYLLLTVFPPLSYLAIGVENFIDLVVAILAVGLLLYIYRGEGMRKWLAIRYDRVVSDIPFFDGKRAKTRSILVVVLFYWFVTAFFLYERAHPIDFKIFTI
jgi:hypothetical protein